MNLTRNLFLLFISILSVTIQAQELVEYNTSTEQVLFDLEKRFEVYFSYDAAILEGKEFSYKGESDLDKILNQIGLENQLKAEYVDSKNIIIHEKEEDYIPLDTPIDLTPLVVTAEYLTSGFDKSKSDGAITLRPNRLGILPGLIEPDIMQSLQLLPGISSPTESASLLHIRGGTPDQNLILFDGIKTYHHGHLFGMISPYNPYIIKDVTVYRSGTSAKYGDRISGVIDMKTTNIVPYRTKIETSSNMLYATANIKTPIVKDKLGALISYRHSFTDFWNSPAYAPMNKKIFQNTKLINKSNSNTPSTLIRDNNFHFSDFNSKITYSPNEKHKLSFSSMLISNALKNISTDDAELTSDDLTMENLGASLEWNAKISEKFSVRAKTHYSRYKTKYAFRLFEFNPSSDNWQEIIANDDKKIKQEGHDDDNDDDDNEGGNDDDENEDEDDENNDDEEEDDEGNDEDDENDDDKNKKQRDNKQPKGKDPIISRFSKTNEVKDVGVYLQGKYTFNKMHELNLGYELSYLDVAYILKYTGKNSFLEKSDSRLINHNAFLKYDFRYNDFFVRAGLRASIFSVRDNPIIEPRLYTDYKINEKVKLKASAEIKNQAISQFVLFKYNYLGIDEAIWGLSDLKEIAILNTKQATLGFIYQSNGWTFDTEAYLKNINGLTSFTRGFDVIANNDSYIFGESHVYGIDFLVKKRIKNFRTWISYTLSQIEYDFPKLYAHRFPGNYDKPHVFNWTNTYKLRNLQLSVGWQYSSGSPFSPAQLKGTGGNQLLSYGTPNSQRLKDYHRLDISALYDFYISRESNIKARVGASIMNVYNQINQVERKYRTRLNVKGEKEFMEQTTQGLGFSPNFIFKVDF